MKHEAGQGRMLGFLEGANRQASRSYYLTSCRCQVPLYLRSGRDMGFFQSQTVVFHDQLWGLWGDGSNRLG